MTQETVGSEAYLIRARVKSDPRQGGRGAGRAQAGGKKKEIDPCRMKRACNRELAPWPLIFSLFMEGGRAEQPNATEHFYLIIRKNPGDDCAQ